MHVKPYGLDISPLSKGNPSNLKNATQIAASDTVNERAIAFTGFPYQKNKWMNYVWYRNHKTMNCSEKRPFWRHELLSCSLIHQWIRQLVNISYCDSTFGCVTSVLFGPSLFMANGASLSVSRYRSFYFRPERPGFYTQWSNGHRRAFDEWPFEWPTENYPSFTKIAPFFGPLGIKANLPLFCSTPKGAPKWPYTPIYAASNPYSFDGPIFAGCLVTRAFFLFAWELLINLIGLFPPNTPPSNFLKMPVSTHPLNLDLSVMQKTKSLRNMNVTSASNILPKFWFLRKTFD